MQDTEGSPSLKLAVYKETVKKKSNNFLSWYVFYRNSWMWLEQTPHQTSLVGWWCGWRGPSAEITKHWSLSAEQKPVGHWCGWECSGEGEVLLRDLGAGGSLEDSGDTEEASMMKTFCERNWSCKAFGIIPRAFNYLRNKKQKQSIRKSKREKHQISKRHLSMYRESNMEI